MGKLYGNHASGSKKHHRDTTHKPITDVLEAFGWRMLDTSMVGPLIPGFPDAIGNQGGITDFFQFKSGDKADFTPAEIDFAKAWTGRPIVNLPSVSAAESWARRERHERRRQSEAKALAACVHRPGGAT